MEKMKKYNASWMWTLSFFGLFALFWDLLVKGLKYEIVYFITMIFTFFVLLRIIAFNFKKRTLYDPKLNTIKIKSVQDMGIYMNKMFLVEFDSPLRYGMYLQSIELRQEDKIFIYLEPLDIDFNRWNKLLREMLGDQPVAAVTFIKETEGDRIGIKFWTFSSEEGRVIYPLRSQW